jgi:O-antigen/teichoic acid export membrane protein
MSTSKIFGLRSLGKNAILYAIGTVIQRAASFVLIPIYTSLLLLAGYGKIETISVMVQMLLIVLNFGLSNAILRFYKESDIRDELGVILRTSFIMVIVLAGIFWLILAPFINTISEVILKEGGNNDLMMLAFLWAVGGALNQQVFAYYRAQQSALTYVALSIGMFVFSICLNIVFIKYLNLGVAGALLGNLAVVWMLNLWFALKWWGNGISISLRWAKIMFQFGGPLIFAGIGWLIIHSSDRYFLAYYWGLEEVGIYSIGYKVGMIMYMLVTTPLQLSWAPYVFANFDPENNSRDYEYGRVLTYFVISLVGVGLALYMFSPFIINFLGSQQTSEAVLVVPYIIIAYAFSGLHYYASVYFHITKRTGLMSAIIFSSAVINIFLNQMLIPSIGWRGAAISTVVTITIVGSFTYIFAQHIFPFRIEILRIAKIAFSMMISLIIFISFNKNIVETRLWVSLLCITIFPFSLILSGFLTDKEISILKGIRLRLLQQVGSIKL